MEQHKIAVYDEPLTESGEKRMATLLRATPNGWHDGRLVALCRVKMDDGEKRTLSVLTTLSMKDMDGCDTCVWTKGKWVPAVCARAAIAKAEGTS